MDLMSDYITQEIVLTVSGTTVKGTYAVDATGKVTLAVTKVTGTMADYIEVGTVFTNQ